MGPVDVVIEGSHWVENLFDYLVMKYPTPFVSVLFVSVIPTFYSNFLIVFLLVFVIFGCISQIIYILMASASLCFSALSEPTTTSATPSVVMWRAEAA